MNILLDAYLDHNFGDDLFVTILTARYPEDRFFIFTTHCPPHEQAWALSISNLLGVPEDDAYLSSGMFDAYIMVGGDMLPDMERFHGDYRWRIRYQQSVRDAGGYVGLLGFNLYEEYGEKSRKEICEMLRLADEIVPRDTASLQMLLTLSQEAGTTGVIRQGGDMAFTLYDMLRGNFKDTTKKQNVLGISIRRKLFVSDEENVQYEENMAALAEAYLRNNPASKVKLLALSTGAFDDRIEAREIIEKLSPEVKKRTEISAYEGDVAFFIREMQQCSAIIATRFHALVFSILLGIPLIPVPYEVKIDYLLEDIGYNGMKIPYAEKLAKPDDVLAELQGVQYDEEKLLTVVRNAQTMFQGFDTWRAKEKNKPARKNQSMTVPVESSMEKELKKTRGKLEVVLESIGHIEASGIYRFAGRFYQLKNRKKDPLQEILNQKEM